MHKNSSKIARTLRALRNAHRLGLLRGFLILPGRDACEAAIEQFSAVYSGDTLPQLPLAQCSCDHCDCKYLPIGSDELRRLDLTGKSSSKSLH
jgi:hypothetical protein